MKEHDVYPSQWLSAGDIPEGGLVVTVRGVSLAEIGRDKESKPVLSFEELDKPLILNKTNWRNMSVLTKEDDSDNWASHKVELYATRVQFGGDEVDAVRIRQPKSKPAAAKPTDPKAIWGEFYRSLSLDEAEKTKTILGGSPSAWMTKAGKDVNACIAFVKQALNAGMEPASPPDDIPFD